MNRNVFLATMLWPAVVLVIPMVSQAQNNTPIQNVNITDIGGDVFILGHYRQDDETRGNTSTNETDFFIEEGVDLNLGGYFYHPNLVDWNASVRLGLTQQRIGINEDDFDSDGTILGYNFAGIVLKEKPVSLRLFASKSDEFINRSFARAVQVDQRVEGAELLTKGAFPMSFLFEHSVDKEESDLRVDDEERSYFRYFVSDERDENYYTSLTYEHEDVEHTSDFLVPGGDVIRQDLPDQRDEVNVLNRYRFGDAANPHRLDGHFRAMQRTGFFENEIFLLDERLELAHTPTFSTFYQGIASIDDTDTQSDRSIFGELGFHKKVYESLDIVGRTIALDRQLDDGSEHSIGGFLDLDYNKNTPIGVYHSAMNIGREYQQEQFEGGQQSIRDEAITLVGVTPVFLREPNVLPGSITVTDSNNVITYVQGIDYFLQQIGTFTQVSRIPSGTIISGQTVLVDYTADAARDADFHTDLFNWSHRIDFDQIPIAIFGSYRLRDEVLDSGDDPGNLDREEVYLVGADLLLDPVTLTGEYEIRNERLFPSSTAYRFRGDLIQAMEGYSVGAGAHYENRQYQDAQSFGFDPGEEFLETYGAFANAATKLNRNLLLRLDGSYLKTRGRENTELAAIGASAVWSYGNMELSIGASYEIFEQEGDEGDSILLNFAVRRSF
jgi:hypothetical protein